LKIKIRNLDKSVVRKIDDLAKKCSINLNEFYGSDEND